MTAKSTIALTTATTEGISMVDQDVIKKHLDNLRHLLTPAGLFLASSHSVQTGYDKAWLRDNVYEALAFEYAGEWKTVTQTYHTLLDIFDKHIDKINWATT